MFNRSREQYEYSPTRYSYAIDQVEFRRNADPVYSCPGGPLEARTSSIAAGVYPLRYSRGLIEDYVVLPKIKHKFRRHNPFSGLPRSVKPVRHTKLSLSNFKDAQGSIAPNQGDVTIVQNIDLSDVLCLHEITRTQTCPPLAFLCARFGADWVKSNILDNLAGSPAPITYAELDWSSLADQFNEQCKSLIPSGFLLGETLGESGIFVDALKLVLNPTKAISGFVKNVQKRGLHRLRLGELNRYYKKLFSKYAGGTSKWTGEDYETARDLDLIKFGAKEVIGSHLQYKFGVVPAVHDTNAALTAHRKVDGALAFLNKHRGRYVPIRVKKGYSASFTPDSFTSPFLDFGPSLLKEAFTVTHIFGQGRVRTDINEASRWRAYLEYFGLNKLIGIAWELIPFSFVVDWFTNSQEAINSITRIPLGESPFMNLAAIGHSWKNVAVYDYPVTPGYDLTNGFPNFEPGDQFPCFSYAITEYNRLPKFPDTSWFANPSNLGLFHAVTGGELLIQKFL